MPPLPEVDDIKRLVRAVEVDRQDNVEHEADADSHIAVAAEVKIELAGVGERSCPSLEKIEAFG